MTLIPVIMSGGVGSRLWPVSRADYPKPFLVLPDGETLIEKTYARALGLEGVDRVVTITREELYEATAAQFDAANLNSAASDFLLEPFGRDTAAATAAAAVHISATVGPDAIALMLPADHLIEKVDAFQSAVREAADLAEDGRIVVFGIRPAAPETGFGYIEAEGSNVLRFVEKPDRDIAEGYVASGRFFWNSGMFCFRAGTMIDAMEKLCPEILAGARNAIDRGASSSEAGRTVVEIDAEAFARVPAISVDYAVMEKTGDLAIVTGSFDWTDIGSWNAIADLVPADEQGNRAIGAMAVFDSRGCFVRSEGRLIGLVGVTDLVVVDGPNGVLVAHRDRVQDVKALYDMLKKGADTAGPEMSGD